MTLDAAPLAGVIGHPIAHSRSPQVHGHWLRTMGLRGHYIPMDIHHDDLADALKMLPKMGFVGINVTIPHKEAVLKLADIVTDRASLIGAANTLIFRPDGKIHADNTDGYGFLENLKQYAPNWDPASGPAMVLGAGGASRAIVFALLEVGVPEIFITNRTRIRAEQLQSDFGKKLKVIDWHLASSSMAEAALVVNTTSLGMVNHPELNLNLDVLHPGQVVTDIVYNPLETTLLRRAREAGCVTVDGLGMLLHQAVPGFERWFGARPEVTEALRIEALK
ncbi:shikimate dehydrogenase [Pseudooceanicola sp. CBS1P-1]|uniref:Shikimate dehydrogenase (NADP(+)) n=1 Tax=Pseudooceanicola albus TaxID=2692189 RepID=A0A6L7FZS6_9RHOB|nr:MULTISPECIES: shikimate dehydrogenase [Pseudooceanicola]MBT9385714.1 shikimate dehydrogenase [Pseudooceanicola endophyticus]MXN16748.1 shikimate dehydrogenase [Pseudooceanicola albus]